MLPHIFAKMPTPCTAIKHRIKISEAQKSIWKTLKKLLKEAKKKNHQHTQIMRGNTIIALPRYKEIVERKEMVLTSMMRHWFSSFFKRLGRGGSLNASCWRHLKFCHVRKYLKNRMLMIDHNLPEIHHLYHHYATQLLQPLPKLSFLPLMLPSFESSFLL